jgi:hypothetical protein
MGSFRNSQKNTRISTHGGQHEFFAKQPRRTFAGERQAEAFIAAGSKRRLKTCR